MESNEFGVSLKIEKIGYLNFHPIKSSLHNVKSLMGSAFHLPLVKSVCVYDNEGTARLYLKKTPAGVVREER
jgi:hypothetical protein